MSCTLLQKYSWNFITVMITEYTTGGKDAKIGMKSNSKLFGCIESILFPVQMVQLTKSTSTDLKRPVCSTCFFSCLTPSETVTLRLNTLSQFPASVCCLRPSANFLKLRGTTRNCSGVRACSVTSVLSNSLRPRGLQATKNLCPWDFPGKNSGVGCYFLLQGIFLTHKSPVAPVLEVDGFPYSHQGRCS